MRSIRSPLSSILGLTGAFLVFCVLPARSQDESRLFQRIDRNTGRHLAFLQELIRSVQEGEEAVQNRVAKRFASLGCRVEVLRIPPTELKLKHEFAARMEVPEEERISVVGTYEGERKGRSLLFFAHPDNPPQEDLDRWIHDPFGAEIEAGRVYGWGVADDLAGVAIMAEALTAIRDAGLEPPGKIVLCSTPAKRNAQGVIALLSRGYTADAAVYLHPAESGAGMKEIKAIASGMLRFRIKVSGKPPKTTEPGKTAFAHLAVNAVDKALVVIRALKDLDDRRGEMVRHPGLDAAVGRSTNLLIGHLQAGSPEALTQVPEECILGASLTFPPSEKLEQVQRQVEECVRRAAASDTWLTDHPPVIEWLFGTQGVEIPVDHPLYRVVSDAIESVTGTLPYVNPLHSASDIRNPILFSGIPTVGLGPLAGDLAQNRAHDEWVDAADFIRAVKITATIMLEWGKTGRD
jgi:acetylornithine deacetylase